MNRRLFLIAAPLVVVPLALAGCAATAIYSAPDAGMVELEPLLGMSVARDSLTIRVVSTGCTTRESFAFFVERKHNRYAVAFGRKALDRCKAAPSPMDLTWTYEELGLPAGSAVAVVNPLAAS